MSPRMGVDLSAILKVAVEIADTKGMDEVTLALVAKKLHIRTPSLYNHINGLKDLRKKLALYGMEQFYNALAHATIGLAEDDAVRSLVGVYVAFARTHPGLYEATLLAPDPSDIEVQRSGSKIVDIVIRVLKAYGVEGEAALHATRGLRSILHGFVSLEQKGGFGLPLDIDVSLNFIIDTFLTGIHALEYQ